MPESETTDLDRGLAAAATRFEGYSMRDSTLTFTPEDKTFLATIRADIATRPDFYRAGIDYLGRRFSADALHATAMKTWVELKDHPTEIASARAGAAHAAWHFTWPDDEPDERDRIERDVFQQLTAPPSKDRGYWLSNCLVHAFSTVLQEGLDTPDDDLNPYDLEKAKAVLCLTWLLTDKNANLHALGEPFGPWLAGQHEYAELPPNDAFALQIAAKGRAMARIATLDELNGECRTRWMELARAAWKVVQTALAGTESGTHASKHRRAAASEDVPSSGRFYVFCRFWPGFSGQFPFDTFNHLPGDKIVGAIHDAVQREFETRPELAAKWQKVLEDEARAQWKKEMEHWRPVTHGGGMIIPRGPRHPKHGQYVVPPPQLRPIPPLNSDVGLQYAMWVLGWRVEPAPPKLHVNPSVLTPTFRDRYLIVAADVEQDAADVVTVLNRQYGNLPSATRFGHFADDGVDRAGKLACEQEIDRVRKAAADPTYPTLIASPLGWTLIPATALVNNRREVRVEVVQYARCALDLLDRMAAERRGQRDDGPPVTGPARLRRIADGVGGLAGSGEDDPHQKNKDSDPTPSDQPKWLAGKEGRRKCVQERYQQLAQERDSGGNTVYPSQEKVIEKLAKELNVSVRTLKEDIKWLRDQKRLPPLPNRKPKEVTNRMHRIDPTRSTAT
jgi:hypothetical protein